MRGKSPAIFLGDLARAVRRLDLNDPTIIKFVAEMLGLSVEVREEESYPARVTPQRMADEEPLRGDEDEDDPAEGEARQSRRVAAEEDRAAIPVEVSRASGEKEAWAPDLGPPPPQDEGKIETPSLVPLLMPQLTRGILSAALATPGGDGPLDVEAVTEMLARCEDIGRLPTLPSWTLGRGAQVLLDKSQAMMPFVKDQAWLLKEIRNVAGAEMVAVLRFVGSPARGAGGGTKPWRRYQPPPPGTPVVLLSDLGSCRPMLAADWAGEDEWSLFAAEVRRSLCPLLAFVPYKPSRWPRRLARLMNIVQWDRVTTAAVIANFRKTSRETELP